MTEFTPRQDLSSGANSLVKETMRIQSRHRHDNLYSGHWLLAVLKRHGPMAENMVAGLNARQKMREMRQRIRDGDLGDPLDVDRLLEAALEHAGERGKKGVSERDLVAAVLSANGYEVSGAQSSVPSSAPESEESATDSTLAKTKLSTPTINKYGRDLTALAREDRIPRIVGRDREIESVVRTLCRRTKRNPVLVGPAGVGKTAIVEGLAQRIVTGDVPVPLRDVRLLELPPSNLTAGAGIVGELEKRVEAIIAEAKQTGIILFIDELHSIVGSGGAQGRGDIGSLLKPVLARGEIACIGATTDDEYRRYIEPDRALERRFGPIAVHEMSAENALMVLQAHRELLEKLRDVRVGNDVLRWLVDFADENLRKRNFPDKGIDLLEQCVVAALVEGESEVSLARAQAVAQEMVGMPIDIDERLAALEREIEESGLLTAGDADALLDRLNITLRGLDLHPLRPATVMLLVAECASNADALASVMARTLFGGSNRVVTLDFRQLDSREDVNTLIGPPPGYVGFEGRRPMHAVARMPRCAVLVRNVEASHPEVRQVFRVALAEGALEQRDGRAIYLSDAVVLLTAAIPVEHRRPIRGFGQRLEGHPEKHLPLDTLEETLGTDFLHAIDIVCAEISFSEEDQLKYFERRLLGRLRDQYQRRGLQLEWDDSVLEWIENLHESHPAKPELTRRIESQLGELLIPHLPEPGAREVKASITAEEGAVRVELDAYADG